MQPPQGYDPDLWTLDAHCDTWYMHEFLHRTGLPPEMQGVDPDAFFRVTLPRLKEGRVRCVFANVGDIGLLTSSAVIDGLYQSTGETGSGITICRNAAEVTAAVRSGNLAVVMACESSFLFLGHPDLMRNWHRLGVRVANLTHGEGRDELGWFATTALGTEPELRPGTAPALQVTPSRDGYMELPEREHLWKKETGLTETGKALLSEIILLGIVCDLSHANDATFREALALGEETGKAKFCCTHSNCASLCRHTRNLTDEMMASLAAQGGVMGLCFFGEFIDAYEPTIDRFVEHVLHALDVMRPDHVGIGSDYDGVPPGAFMAVPHPGRMGDLWVALSDAGIPAPTLRKIAHDNFLGLL